MSTAKRGEVRKNEILDIAERIFIAKGYMNATINDILDATGIAKGSLYYYFKSKEDVLDGVIKRHGDVIVETASRIADAEGLDAREKLLHAMLSLQPPDEQKRQLIRDLERSSNGHMFLKSLTDILLRIAPIFGSIVAQGVTEGLFSTPYPRESCEFLLASAHALFDNANLHWTPEEQAQKMKAFFFSMERILGIEEGSLDS